MTGKYLITTDNWFYAPDGRKYKAAWGEVQIVEDTVLGIKTNRNSTNWYAKVGNGYKHILIAGCQIHYAVRCKEKPNHGKVSETMYNNDGGTLIERDPEIYIAE